MSLAQITEKIRNDALREAEEILAGANAKAQNIAQRAEEENDSVKTTFARRFEEEKPEILKRREIVAKLDVKKMMLRSRRDVVRDVYSAALAGLGDLERSEYLSFCAALLKAAVATKEEIVRVGAGEKYIDEAWIGDYNQKNGAKLVLSEDTLEGITGGFILENGRISVNCSWEMLIRIAQEKFEADVIKRLFQSAE